MNNSVFGKTLENVRQRQNIKLITDETKLNKYVKKPGYISSKIFNENLMAVPYVKEKLVLDKPIYVGFCILDLSKWLMYDFHYGYMKKNMVRMHSSYLLTRIHCVMRLKQKIFTRTCMIIENCLI